jgi:flagellar biosynthesis protein
MKKIKKAAALKYENGYNAPIVTATGIGYISDKIVEKARDNDVPIVYNKELADLLVNVEVGDNIPADLYEAVASVIAYIINLDKNENRG